MVGRVAGRGCPFAAMVLGLAATPLAAQDSSALAAPRPAAAADVASIDAVIAALYDVISGPAGEARDWDRFRSLFAAGARLIPTRPTATGGTDMRMLDPQGYIDRARPLLEGAGFFEREIGRVTEEFGNIAHVFSAYASFRSAGDSVPFQRGINSIQLLKDGDQWRIVTVMWDAERPGVTIPDRYLRASAP